MHNDNNHMNNLGTQVTKGLESEFELKSISDTSATCLHNLCDKYIRSNNVNNKRVLLIILIKHCYALNSPTTISTNHLWAFLTTSLESFFGLIGCNTSQSKIEMLFQQYWFNFLLSVKKI